MKTKEIALSSLFAALMCVLSPFSIPMTVPISLSVLAVFITALCQRPKAALVSTLVYIALGSVGVPVFSGFNGGIQVLAGPTGGFIMAYPIMAFIISYSVNHFTRHRAVAKICSMIVALIVCYAIGTFFFCVSTKQGVAYAISACVAPFVLIDLAKIAAAYIISLFFDKTNLSKLMSD